jgi:membrane glycosyltransferase
MVILDADSLMTGQTLVEMVRRMDDDPDIGIRQVPPVLVNRDSLFARLLQFSTDLYGNVFRSGFSLWAGAEGNYWGHNAILRIEPFMRHCGLPHLPGSPPWGGEILSHDFVEAALMVRAGWKVVVASDLGGSYEECPGNLIDFAKRDERWSMGNLQHLPLVVAGGIHPVSRFHMGVGALSYVASPLWALFMLLSAVQGIGWQMAGDSTPAAAHAGLPTAVALAPLVGALALLLMVKVWVLVAALCRRSLASGFGTPGKLTLSVLLETVVSCLLAPILMAFHTTFVVNSLLGRKVAWEAQSRGEKDVSWSETFRVHAPHTIAGLAAALLVTWGPHGLFWWMLPILLGLVFSVPISLLMSSVRLGRRLRAAGILLIPEEVAPPPILKHQRSCLADLAATSAGAAHPFVRLVADPLCLRLHRALLPSPARPAMQPAVRERLERIALSGGRKHITRAERLLLMQDDEALVWLHREVWKDWPVELLHKVAAAR